MTPYLFLELIFTYKRSDKMNKLFWFLLAVSIPVFAVTFDGTETPVEHINKLNQMASETGGAIAVQEGGSEVTPNVNLFNFTGAGVAVSEPVADQVTVTISSGVSEGTDILSTGETVGLFLRADGDNTSSWGTPAGGGNVTGPASAADDRIATFNGTTGELIQDGGETVAEVLARANHTGNQAASTISDFDTEVDTEVGNNSAVVLNTAKDTNANHSGDVSGLTTLTIQPGAVDVAHISATGTPSATTYYRGDNTWATVVGGSGGSVINIQSTAPGSCTHEDTYWNSVEGEAYVCLSGTWALDNAPVDDTVYGISWDGSKKSVTQDRIYDKIETITGGAGTVMKVDTGSNLATADFQDGGDIDFSESAGAVTAAIKTAAVDIAHISASGTPSATTYYRGDNTWGTPSGGGGGTLTTKGDLESYTTTQTRLAVGTDDYVLTADSSAAAGVAWKVASSSGGMNDLIDDTAPQLGGDLDANGFDILMDGGTGIYDSLGNEQLIFAEISSAANYVTINNNMSGNAPSVRASGSDTNIDLSLDGQGTGDVSIASDDLKVAGTVDGVDIAAEETRLANTSGTNTGNSQTLANGVSDVTATSAELNLLDLAGLTSGYVLSADTATTASWKAQTGSSGGTTVKIDSGADLTAADFVSTGDIDFVDTTGTVTANINDGAIIFSKMADIPTDQFLGRDTAGDGVVEIIAMTAARSMLNVVEGPHNTSLATSATDVNATAAQVDSAAYLTGLTAGHVYSADTATTASWKAQTGSGGGTTMKVDSGSDLSTADFVSTGDIDFIDTAGTITANINSASIVVADLANGNSGELITWSSGNVATVVSAGTADYVLTANGVASAPTWQAAPTSEVMAQSDKFWIEDATATDDFRFPAPVALTVSSLECKTTGSPSAHIVTVVECSGTDTSCVTTGLTLTFNASGIQSDTTVTNGTIDSGDYWGLETTSLTTAADVISCAVDFTND